MARKAKFPYVYVELSDKDEGAPAIVERVTRALIRAGHGDAAFAFKQEVEKGAHEHLLKTAKRYVNIY